MLTVVCTKKFTDRRNRIIGYEVTSLDGKESRQVDSYNLKKLVKEGKISITNLKLTSDERFIDSANKTMENSQSNGNTVTKLGPIKLTRGLIQQVCWALRDTKINNSLAMSLSFKSCTDETFINKASMMGLNIEKLDTNIYMVRLDPKNVVLAAMGQWVLPKDASELFNNIDQFDHISFNEVDTSKTTSMNRMFYNCKVKSLDLSNFDTRNVVNMANMFCKCSVESLDLSSFKTRKVTNMGAMFYQCSVKYLDLSNFDTRNVVNMGFMFYQCAAKRLNLSNFNVSNARHMNDMFHECQAESLDLSSFKVGSTTDLYGIFTGYYSNSITTTDRRLLKAHGDLGDISWKPE